MEQNRQILGKERTVRELLSGKKYTIDYYQREFKWGEKQITELIDDLVDTFYEYYAENHIRKDVANYGYYFLGSVIISIKNGQNFIIDGQQRLTSLTLLLIFLNNLQKEKETELIKIDDFIYSERYGEKSFNLYVEERDECLESLFEKGEYENGAIDSQSVHNLINAYEFINNSFPDDLKAEQLLFFIDWLIDNVVMVEIKTYSDQDAYRVFETMNDRGLSLTPTEMLKGHLLSNIRDEKEKNECNDLWKKRIKVLSDFDKDVDADCLKAWFRSQYAESIRERKRGAQPQDYDKIGTEFHRWIRDNEERLKLKKSDSYSAFIKSDFNFYSGVYIKLLNYSRNYTDSFESLFYTSQVGFTLHFPLILSPLILNDNEDIIDKKIQITGLYLDIMLHRRLWNFRSIDYSTMSYGIFQTMKEIRRKNHKEVIDILKQKLMEEKETFENSRSQYRLHMMNKKHVRNVLARLTAYTETHSNQTSHYVEYITSRGKNRYEIEHIWADKYERHKNEFSSVDEFQQHRNLIGGLLLLPKSFNASYGALTYEKKLKHYYGQNLLAKSLHKDCFERNPGFINFINSSKLNFRNIENFNKDDLLERQRLYESIAEKIWNPNLLDTFR